MKRTILLPLTGKTLCYHSPSEWMRAVGTEEGMFVVPETYGLSNKYIANLEEGPCRKCNKAAKNKIIEKACELDSVIKQLKCPHCGKKV